MYDRTWLAKLERLNAAGKVTDLELSRARIVVASPRAQGAFERIVGLIWGTIGPLLDGLREIKEAVDGWL